MFLTWDKSLTVDGGVVDSEHREFLAFLDDVLCLTSDEDIKVDLVEIMDHCTTYIDRHFINEELFIERVGYPNADIHTTDHHALRSRLDSIMSGIARREDNIKYKLFACVITYAHRHINIHDRRLSRFCREDAVDDDCASIA